MIENFVGKIIEGDILQILKTIPAESVDMIITSPPYYALRNYGVDGQLGLEKTFDEYKAKILEITAELKRVLKKSGQLWWNMGDVYGGSNNGSSDYRPEGVSISKNDKKYQGQNAGRIENQKCLIMMPERIALEMIDKQGWILRNKIKWAKQVLLKKENITKGSVMPTSVKDRFNESGEELYFFVKNKKYYSDLDAVRLKTENNYEDFNRRVRDAQKGIGPQFRASEEEIKRYNEIPEDYGKKKLQNLPDKGKNLNRWMSGTPNYTYQKSLESRMEDTKNKDQKSSRAYNLKKLLSEVRLGIKPNTGMESKKVLQIYGNDLKGSRRSRVRDFMDNKNKRWHGQKEAGVPLTYIGPTGEDHNLLNNPLGKNLPSVWLIGSEPHNFQKEVGSNCDHFATFPEALLEIPIKFGCPKGGIVLDCFMGAGTSAIVAKKLGRNFIGIELNPKYIELAEKRIRIECPPSLF